MAGSGPAAGGDEQAIGSESFDVATGDQRSVSFRWSLSWRRSTSPTSSRPNADRAMNDRIAVDPDVLVGKPVIKGTRIAVEFVVDLMARGWTTEQILDEYDHLTTEDVRACQTCQASVGERGRGTAKLEDKPALTESRNRSRFERGFATKRPWVYHLTAGANIARIDRMRRLDCAARIMNAGGSSSLVRRRRQESLVVQVGPEDVHVRDQKPLHRKNMCLLDCSFEEWVAHLNSFVFFWPGWAGGPIDSGLRHFGRYASERPALIRVRTADLFGANPDRSPRFSCYNTGAPRWSGGRASPRGQGTFAFGEQFARGASKVVEVVYGGSALLPTTAELGDRPQGPWRPLSGVHGQSDVESD